MQQDITPRRFVYVSRIYVKKAVSGHIPMIQSLSDQQSVIIGISVNSSLTIFICMLDKNCWLFFPFFLTAHINMK